VRRTGLAKAYPVTDSDDDIREGREHLYGQSSLQVLWSSVSGREG
jgi:hypothetical protein